MKLYINPHTNPVQTELVGWSAESEGRPEYKPSYRYFVEVLFFIGVDNIEDVISDLKVYFTTNRKRELEFYPIRKNGYYDSSVEKIRIYVDEQLEPTDINQLQLVNHFFE